jgi:17beta-estradiol 17-dehydrogenase / very-long-chain 3-oxoacyl-CoA reductase
MFSYLMSLLETYSLKSLLNVILLISCLKFIYFLYKNFIRQRKDLLTRYGKKSWALVTGATDGIGKALCIELARSGFNIILVSRNPQKLKNVAQELLIINTDIETHTIPYDFDNKSTLKDYTENFSNLTKQFDISILINNVGTEQHNYFDKVKIDYLISDINVNIIPQTILTKIFMKSLNSRTKRSAIINLSSFAGEFPFPMKSVYSATKIYNHFLSIGLMEETSLQSSIDWLSVKPLEVETVLSTTKADGIFVVTPKQCADSILNDLGHESETYSHWTHKIQAWVLLTLVPRSLFYFVVKRFWFKWFIKRDEKTE